MTMVNNGGKESTKGTRSYMKRNSTERIYVMQLVLQGWTRE
jgi:hypothetical protein